MLGAEAVIQSLVEEGVPHIFGQGGGEICPLIQAIGEIAPHMGFTMVRSEENACHMASGYYRSGGKIAVCLLSTGATQVLTGIAAAYSDKTPMVVVMGQAPTKLLGQDGAVDMISATGNLVKHSYLVKQPEDIPQIFKDAFHLAKMGGPVLVEIPEDVQIQDLGSFVYPQAPTEFQPVKLQGDFTLQRATTLLAKAKFPVLCLGGGVISSGLRQKIREFAEKYNMPVLSTREAVGVLPTNHPLNLGVLQAQGKARITAMNQADLCLVIGAKISTLLSLPEFAQKTKILSLSQESQYDDHPDVFSLVGDLPEIIEHFSQSIEAPESQPQHTHLQELRKEELLSPYGTIGIHPANFFRQLGMKIQEDALLCVDSGVHQDYALWHLYCKAQTKVFINSRETKGFALPCAIGAKLASSGQTFAICGDGGFQRSFPELSAVLSHHLDIKIILFQNHVIGRLYEGQKSAYGRAFRADLDGSPDFLALAHAYGIPAGRITQESEVEIALEYFLEERGTQLLIVEINKDITNSNYPDPQPPVNQEEIL